MLKKFELFVGLFLALATIPKLAKSDTTPSPVDPVLLNQIQASLEDDRNQAKAALAKARSELQSISDPVERKKREDGINQTEREFQERFAATQGKIEKSFTAGEPVESRPAASGVNTPVPPQQNNLAGFDLSITPDELMRRDKEFKCQQFAKYQPGISEVKIPFMHCRKQAEKDEDDGEPSKRTATSFSFYNGKVFSFVTRVPKGVPFKTASEQLDKKTNSRPKRVKTGFVEGEHRFFGCGVAADFMIGKAIIVVGIRHEYLLSRHWNNIHQIDLAEMDMQFQELPEKDDSCSDKDNLDGEFIFYKSGSIEKQMSEDLERAVQNYKNSNKTNFSL